MVNEKATLNEIVKEIFLIDRSWVIAKLQNLCSWNEIENGFEKRFVDVESVIVNAIESDVSFLQFGPFDHEDLDRRVFEWPYACQLQ